MYPLSTLKDFQELLDRQKKVREQIKEHETKCELFSRCLKEGYIHKEEMTCDIYYLNMTNPKGDVWSQIVYNCPFCFQTLMEPVV